MGNASNEDVFYRKAMSRIWINITDAPLAFTVKMLLRNEGHEAVASAREADACVTNDLVSAVEHARALTVVVLVPSSEIPRAVEAMAQGVYGYALLPLIPKELPLVLARALDKKSENRSEKDEGWASLAEMERKYIQKVLRHCKYNRTRAAEILKIGRNTLWRKLREFESEDSER